MIKAMVAVIVFWSVLLFSALSHAETNAEKVFGKWEKVTVAEILKPVPEFVYGAGYGAIQPKKAEVKVIRYCSKISKYGYAVQEVC